MNPIMKDRAARRCRKVLILLSFFFYSLLLEKCEKEVVGCMADGLSLSERG
jgi:hypothetical protein